MSAKLAIFTTALKEGQYDIDEAFEAFIVAQLKKAGLDQPVTPATETEAPVAKTKKLTAYNIFVSEKMQELKDIPYNERMKKVGELWTATKADAALLAQYEQKAAAATPVPMVVSAVQKKKGPKVMTGYQFYVSEQMPTVKADVAIPSKGRLKKIGSLWKALSSDKQAEYKKLAEIKDAEIKAAALIEA